MRLTKKQQLFCDEYLIDLNATQAAIRAGYKEHAAYSTGAENLKKPQIQSYLEERFKARQERTEIDQDYVVKVIHETVERCRQAEPVADQFGNPVMIATEKGEVVPAYVFDAKNVLKGAELLGKYLGIFERDNKQRRPMVKIVDLSGGGKTTA
jgi:phage terminase small subunit